MQFINLKKQYQLIEKDIINGIQTVLNHGQYIMGPEIDALEKQLASFVGVRHAIVNSSGTDALLMALLALGIGPGDEVITSPFSFFATAEVIALCQAKPVFVDINPSTYNIDPGQIEAAITSRTKAIMPVSLFGQCADMNAINLIAKKYCLPVIEDGAQSFGATHHGKYSCGLSTIGCTSFFPSKPLGGYGDAGACFTNSDDLAKKLVEIRNHGQSKRYCHSSLGINGRMDTIQAAILIEKLKLFPQEIKLRHMVAKRYYDLLIGIVKLPLIETFNTSVHAQFTIEVINRDECQKKLQALGIPTAVHYPIPLHQQPALKHLMLNDSSFEHANWASQHVISLPMGPYLTLEEQQEVVEGIKNVCMIEDMI